MDLRFEVADTSRYTSGTQIARVVTENWAEQNLYCPACASDRLSRTKNNLRAVDFVCPACRETYQLKSGRTLPRTRIVDSAFETMIAAVRSDTAPNLIYLHYTPSVGVNNLLLVPSYFFTEDCIERRNPLGPHARRAGWIGCNIRVDRIEPQGKIDMVAGGLPVSVAVVRSEYSRLRPHSSMPSGFRGWRLNLLEMLQEKEFGEFTLAEAYELEGELAVRYPNNRNVRPKIRQQLKVLRDMGVLELVQRGVYRLRQTSGDES